MPDDFGRETASKLRCEGLAQFIEVKACKVREAALVLHPFYIPSCPRLGLLVQGPVSPEVRQGSAGTQKYGENLDVFTERDRRFQRRVARKTMRKTRVSQIHFCARSNEQASRVGTACPRCMVQRRTTVIRHSIHTGAGCNQPLDKMLTCAIPRSPVKWHMTLVVPHVYVRARREK